MKTMTKLGVLAALAALSSSALQAVTIDLNTVATQASAPTYTDTGGNVYHGYIYVSGAWTQTNPHNAITNSGGPNAVLVKVTNGQGIGVDNQGNNVAQQVDDVTRNEFLVIDFGSNYLAKSDFSISVLAYGNGNLTYFWSSALPSGATPVLTDVTNTSSGTPAGSAYHVALTVADPDNPGDYFGPTSLQGTVSRYLILGANPQAAFTLAQVSYTQVPEGGLTVTLLGAALGSLGLISFRRRKI
jgi:hypothetical protein